MRDPDIPAVVSDLLGWWLPEIRLCLGHNLHSVTLYGSVTLDDFCPRWSDVDVCVLLKAPISHGDGVAIGRVHDRMGQRFLERADAPWTSGQAIEGFYVPVELASAPHLLRPCYTAGGSTREWAVGDPLSPFDRYLLAHRGRPLAGAGVAFAPPSREDLVRQSERDLRDLRVWDHGEGRSAIWLCGMLHWIARSLVFWRDGQMLSKSGALRHEIHCESQFADAFGLALDIRDQGSAAAAGYRDELRGFVGQVAGAAAEEIEKHMRA